MFYKFSALFENGLMPFCGQGSDRLRIPSKHLFHFFVAAFLGLSLKRLGRHTQCDLYLCILPACLLLLLEFVLYKQHLTLHSVFFDWSTAGGFSSVGLLRNGFYSCCVISMSLTKALQKVWLNVPAAIPDYERSSTVSYIIVLNICSSLVTQNNPSPVVVIACGRKKKQGTATG